MLSPNSYSCHFSTTLLKIAKFQLHLRAEFGHVRAQRDILRSILGVFFFYVPVAGEISSSLKYNIDNV